ncbi:hypothetical protein evm_004987 [Chilo suppressalis]|nr:hypothetical protein evm_004987 [Chilo suppressalis]
MSKRIEHYETMLFNNETTARTDFRGGAIKPIVRTVYKENPPCLRPRPPPLKDTHALTDWRIPNVPFNLMHKPKEIVQTNPRQIQEPHGVIVDDLQKEIQMTRPRLFLTPAVPLDDAGESDRDTLIRDIYTTSSAKIARDSNISATNNVRAPLSPVLAPANPITLEKLQACYVSPEWRMDSVSWDSRQLRADCNPTRDFWLARTPKCKICKETSERESNQKLKRITQRRH